MQFDIVILLGPKHGKVFEKNIMSIVNNIDAGKVIIISNADIISKLEVKYPDFVFIDENTLIKSLDLNLLKNYLSQKGKKRERAGWYFQQFLKMGYAYHSQNPYYLVWDSDTVPHRKLHFFSDEKILFSYSEEYHQPYFVTMKRLIGLEKSFSKSFVVEHMMFDREIMIELINEIQSKDTSKPWALNILDAIDEQELGRSGFSEFETYGTFVYHRYKHRYTPRYIWHNRKNTDKFYFYFLRKKASDIFDTSSFESRQKVSMRRYKYICNEAKNKKKDFKEITW